MSDRTFVEAVHEASSADDERALNEHYVRHLDDERRRMAEAYSRVTSFNRNSVWVERKGTSIRTSTPIDQQLFGRVGLSESIPEIPGHMYVGTDFAKLDSATVVSWANPVASLFYEGRASTDALAAAVLGTRSLVVDRNGLQVFDDLEPGVTTAQAFPRVGPNKLAIPAPPTTAEAPKLRPEERPDTPAIPEGTSSDQPRSVSPLRVARGLRATDAVVAAVTKPRTGELFSVLSTLQPDQYDLVTWPAEKPLIVQGGPGTGKTVVAIHRAAYLVHPDCEDGPLERVLVVGPTEEYCAHIRRVASEIGGDRILVRSASELLRSLAGLSTGPDGIEHDRVGSDWAWSRILRRVAKERGISSEEGDRGTRYLVSNLITRRSLHQPRFMTQEQASWLVELRSFDYASTRPGALPFLAAAGLAVKGPLALADHLVVDEAQDVPLLVWRVLLDHVRSDMSLTIVGDVNQRRSDWTPADWSALASDLQVSDDHGDPPLRVLDIAYRSTRQILQFANQLLPRADRGTSAVVEGSPPTVRRVAAHRLVSEVLSELDVRQGREDGLTAVITTSPGNVTDAARKAGYQCGGSHKWRSAEREFLVLRPEEARGLEFDVVVVVEPDAFPRNVGRLGSLYTSLTRATRELVVLHARPLPAPLRVRRASRPTPPADVGKVKTTGSS